MNTVTKTEMIVKRTRSAYGARGVLVGDELYVQKRRSTPDREGLADLGQLIMMSTTAEATKVVFVEWDVYALLILDIQEARIRGNQ